MYGKTCSLSKESSEFFQAISSALKVVTSITVPNGKLHVDSSHTS